MPKRTDPQSIPILGSGPIVIGQTAEFDDSGTQALRALREVLGVGSRSVITNDATSAIALAEPHTGASGAGEASATAASSSCGGDSRSAIPVTSPEPTSMSACSAIAGRPSA